MNSLDNSKKVNCILLASYLVVISMGQILVSDLFAVSYIGVGFILSVILASVIAPALLHWFSHLPFELDAPQGIIYKKEELILYAVPLLVFLYCYIAYYPGAFSEDSIDQIKEAFSNQYNDWHPVFHTLVFFKLPLLMSGGWIGSIALFQILVFSLSLGYCFCLIDRYAGRLFTVISMVFVLANPLTWAFSVFPCKDVAFAIAVLLLMAFSLQIYITKGAWMASPSHTAAFIIAFLVATLCRHNAILFTLPLLLAIFFQISHKRFLLIIIVIITLIYTIKGPLYKALQVESPDNRQVETLGFPMTVIGAAVKYDAERTDESVLRFAYQVAPPEVWENYFYGAFNPVKSSADLSVIEEYGRVRVIQMALLCIKNSPLVCLKSIVMLTEGIFTVTHPHPILLLPCVCDNTLGITTSSPRILRYFANSYFSFIADFFPRLFLYYGIFHLVIIITILAFSRLNSWTDWKRILFVLPLFSYNYGTSLLLSTYNDSLLAAGENRHFESSENRHFQFN